MLTAIVSTVAVPPKRQELPGPHFGSWSLLTVGTIWHQEAKQPLPQTAKALKSLSASTVKINIRQNFVKLKRAKLENCSNWLQIIEELVGLHQLTIKKRKTERIMMLEVLQKSMTGISND